MPPPPSVLSLPQFGYRMPASGCDPPPPPPPPIPALLGSPALPVGMSIPHAGPELLIGPFGNGLLAPPPDPPPPSSGNGLFELLVLNEPPCDVWATGESGMPIAVLR